MKRSGKEKKKNREGQANEGKGNTRVGPVRGGATQSIGVAGRWCNPIANSRPGLRWEPRAGSGARDANRKRGRHHDMSQKKTPKKGLGRRPYGKRRERREGKRKPPSSFFCVESAVTARAGGNPELAPVGPIPSGSAAPHNFAQLTNEKHRGLVRFWNDPPLTIE